MKNILLSTFALFAAACCNVSEKDVQGRMPEIRQGDVLAQVNLTVAEGKRLIAEGIANDPEVKARLSSGMIIITRGTTNTYIAERLAGLDAPHGSFMTGNITPVKVGVVGRGIEKTGEIVLVNGVVTPMGYEEALEKLSPGDIIFKGANLLNYSRNQAGVCIGLADGGTVGKLRPYVGEGKARLIVPVGLEKESSFDLSAIETLRAGDNGTLNSIPRLWVHRDAVIFTEIEALKSFAAVEVFPIAAGGIAGREGGVSLVVAGKSAEVEKALAVVGKLQGEPAFMDAPEQE